MFLVELSEEQRERTAVRGREKLKLHVNFSDEHELASNDEQLNEQ